MSEVCTCRLACYECPLSGEWHTHNEPCPTHINTPINVPRGEWIG